MLFSLQELHQKYNMEIRGILHLGAHLGEEAQDYENLFVKNVWWVEANPHVMDKLRENLRPYNHHLIQALLTDVDGEFRNFNITNYDGMSSSIFEFGKLHLDSSPDTQFVDTALLESRTVDSLVAEFNITDCNFLNMDLQGAEVLVLQGAVKTIESIDYVYTEVNIGEVYEGCGKMWQIDDFLSDFDRVETYMTPAQWGDALYIRRSLR